MLCRKLCVLLAVPLWMGLIGCGGGNHAAPSSTSVTSNRPSAATSTVPPFLDEHCPLATNAEVSEAIGIPVKYSHEYQGSQVGCEYDFDDGDATNSYLEVRIERGQDFDSSLNGFCHDVDRQNVKLDGIGTEAYLCTPLIVVARVSPDKGFTVFVTTSAQHSTLRPDAAQAVARLVAPRIT